MRISDWSSDVCSSDLSKGQARRASHWSYEAERPLSRRQGESLLVEPGTPLRGVQIDAGHGAAPYPCAIAAKATPAGPQICRDRSGQHTSELQSLMRTSFTVICLNKKRSTLYSPLTLVHLSYLA